MADGDWSDDIPSANDQFFRLMGQNELFSFHQGRNDQVDFILSFDANAVINK